MELFFILDERAWQRLSVCGGKRRSDDSYHHLQRPLSVRSLPEFNRHPHSLSLLVEFRPMTLFILVTWAMPGRPSVSLSKKAPVIKCKWA